MFEDIRRKISKYSGGAEGALIGAIVNDYKNMYYACESLTQDHFSKKDYRTIFEAIRKNFYIPKTGSISIPLVSDILSHEPRLEGIIKYLFKKESKATIEAKIDLVKHLYSKRSCINAIRHATASIYKEDESCSPIDALRDAAKELSVIESKCGKVTIESLYDEIHAIDGWEANRLKILEDPESNKVPVVKTGFYFIDTTLGGIAMGELMIISARPGIGKSTLLRNIYSNIILQGTCACYSSLEEPKKDFIDKICSSMCSISLKRIYVKEELSEEENKKIKECFENPSIKNMLFIGVEATKVEDIISSIRDKIRFNPIKVLFIDYIQILSSKHIGDNRLQELTYITRALKLFALEVGIGIICAAQLSRKAEDRGSRPVMSDLRESGSIEQDADKVIALYNDGDTREHAVAVLKNRSGECRDFRLVIDFKNSAFRDIMLENQF